MRILSIACNLFLILTSILLLKVIAIVIISLVSLTLFGLLDLRQSERIGFLRGGSRAQQPEKVY